jgi:hypothetical protein
MHRRSFLALLSAVPGLAWLKPAAPVFLSPDLPAKVVSSVFKVGDVFTIEGQWAVNPPGVERRELQEYRITSVPDDHSLF